METQQALTPTNSIHCQQMIALVPLAMRVPNEAGVYDLSRYSPFRVVTREEFEGYISRLIRIGTPERNTIATAWGYGLSCWYLALPIYDTLSGDYNPPVYRDEFDILSLKPLALSYCWDWVE